MFTYKQICRDFNLANMYSCGNQPVSLNAFFFCVESDIAIFSNSLIFQNRYWQYALTTPLRIYFNYITLLLNFWHCCDFAK